MANAESLMETNARAGKAFLEQNAKADGVKATASGLQYKVVTPGPEGGKRPGPTSMVTVNYEGRHLNGEVFDSSYKRNQPIDFPLNRVIKGWTEGLQLMTEGAKYQLFIPPELAYGQTGAGGAIGPQETLIFDVELLKVQ
ncbi:MAG: FKBP-type peptidyl-prolyl cis-trans isomerase [Thiotrichales bacterium]